MIQKIWCTYHSAGSLLAGGLERVSVWFSEPVWSNQAMIDDVKEYLENSPFQLSEREGLPIGSNSWGCNNHRHGEDKNCHSFAHLYGYDSELSQFVWQKLCEHFGSDDLHVWFDKGRSGEVSPMTFLLEIELKIPTFKLRNQIL